jgi:hypothetical protein
MVENVPYGEYTYTITTPCYETVTGNVTVGCNNGEGVSVFAEPAEIPIDVTVTLDGAVLTAAAAGLTYQWVDCDNGNAPIVGATAQSYAPTVNGNYAVIIISGDCSQTSACTAVTVTGTEDLESDGAFVVYPNPFNDRFTVRTDVQAGNVHVELFNTDGRLVLHERHNGSGLITMHTQQLSAGSYMLRVTTDNESSTTSVVK